MFFRMSIWPIRSAMKSRRNLLHPVNGVTDKNHPGRRSPTIRHVLGKRETHMPMRSSMSGTPYESLRECSVLYLCIYLSLCSCCSLESIYIPKILFTQVILSLLSYICIQPHTQMSSLSMTSDITQAPFYVLKMNTPYEEWKRLNIGILKSHSAQAAGHAQTGIDPNIRFVLPIYESEVAQARDHSVPDNQFTPEQRNLPRVRAEQLPANLTRAELRDGIYYLTIVNPEYRGTVGKSKWDADYKAMQIRIDRFNNEEKPRAFAFWEVRISKTVLAQIQIPWADYEVKRNLNDYMWLLERACLTVGGGGLSQVGQLIIRLSKLNMAAAENNHITFFTMFNEIRTKLMAASNGLPAGTDFRSILFNVLHAFMLSGSSHPLIRLKMSQLMSQNSFPDADQLQQEIITAISNYEGIEAAGEVGVVVQANAVNVPSNRRTSGRNKHVICWNCGEPGHRLDACKKSVSVCAKCGERGHCTATHDSVAKAKQNQARKAVPAKQSNKSSSAPAEDSPVSFLAKQRKKTVAKAHYAETDDLSVQSDDEQQIDALVALQNELSPNPFDNYSVPENQSTPSYIANYDLDESPVNHPQPSVDEEYENEELQAFHVIIHESDVPEFNFIQYDQSVQADDLPILPPNAPYTIAIRKGVSHSDLLNIPPGVSYDMYIPSNMIYVGDVAIHLFQSPVMSHYEFRHEKVLTTPLIDKHGALIEPERCHIDFIEHLFKLKRFTLPTAVSMHILEFVGLPSPNGSVLTPCVAIHSFPCRYKSQRIFKLLLCPYMGSSDDRFGNSRHYAQHGFNPTLAHPSLYDIIPYDSYFFHPAEPDFPQICHAKDWPELFEICMDYYIPKAIHHAYPTCIHESSPSSTEPIPAYAVDTKLSCASAGPIFATIDTGSKINLIKDDHMFHPVFQDLEPCTGISVSGIDASTKPIPATF